MSNYDYDDKSALPPFPVDAETLDLLEASMTTANAEGASSLWSTLDLLAGIHSADDPQHLRPFIDDNGHIHFDIMVDDRIHYHPNDVMLRLIAEIRRLRYRESLDEDRTRAGIWRRLLRQASPRVNAELVDTRPVETVDGSDPPRAGDSS